MSDPVSPIVPEQQQPLPAGTLTAGSFDDALNQAIFTEYYKQTGLADLGIESLANADWQALIPPRTEAPHAALDVAFVIDVTGSMSDELRYLQVEFKDIMNQVKARFPAVRQRFGLVVYRDEGDEFITRGMQFSDDLEVFHAFLGAQSAGGGGDYEEAVHLAFADANQRFSWGSQDVAKILFHVADAPPHDPFVKATLEQVFLLKKAGVSIYPVAASGVADKAEAVMRTAAVLTGGQYLFLTDDSGVGSAHEKPHFPCYHVEKLKEIMIRAIGDKIQGTHTDPAPGSILRTVGTPVHGVCSAEQVN